MVEVDGEITIGRPPDEVVHLVANEPRYTADAAGREDHRGGPIGVGTSFRAEMTGKARVVPMTIEFTGFDRSRRLAERVDMKTMDLTDGLTFEPTDGGTRMRWSWDLGAARRPEVRGPRRGEHGTAAGAKDLDEAQAAP